MVNVREDSLHVSVLGPNDSNLWKLDHAPRNIYVAAPMTEQIEALRFALQLVDAGFVVTSRWMRNDFSARPLPHHWQQWKAYEANWGENDLEDLARADTLIILAKEPSTSGGYHVELGYFLGSGKGNIIVVGDRPNVFFWTSQVRFAPNTNGLVEWLLHSAHGSISAPENQEHATEGEF